MPTRRPGILDLAALVALCAIDAGWVRALSKAHQSFCGLAWPAFDIGVLAMGSVLTAVGWLLLRRRVGVTPGRVGFMVAGGLTLGAYYYLGRYQGSWVSWYLGLIYPFSRRLGFDPHTPPNIYVGNVVMVLSPFLVLAGWGGLAGWVLGRWRRRWATTPGETAPVDEADRPASP